MSMSIRLHLDRYVSGAFFSPKQNTHSLKYSISPRTFQNLFFHSMKNSRVPLSLGFPSSALSKDNLVAHQVVDKSPHPVFLSPVLESTRARQALTDAESALARSKSDQSSAQESLDSLFKLSGFGAEGEWKKLDQTCLEKDTGEYTYEICLFGEAKQKPNNGGSTFSLGSVQCVRCYIPTHHRLGNLMGGIMRLMSRKDPHSTTPSKCTNMVLDAGMVQNAVLRSVRSLLRRAADSSSSPAGFELRSRECTSDGCRVGEV